MLNQLLIYVKKKDKRVFGVIGGIEDIDKKIRKVDNFAVKSKNGDRRVEVNSLGEGGIWVCNYNGVFENGDYIISSDIPGYGMKQDDEFLHNYTVAKITCDCDFNLESPIYICEEFQWEGQTYRRAFVGCTYHCG